MRFAAIGVTPAARITPLAVDVGLDRTPVTGLHIRHPVAHGENFHAKLVAGNSRIGKNGIFPR